jgi:hypothetical protein
LADLDTYRKSRTSKGRSNVKLQLFTVLKHHTMKVYNGVEENFLAFFKLGNRQGRVVNFFARKLQIHIYKDIQD